MNKQWIHQFLSKLTITKSGCWEWTASVDSSGYGIFWIGRRISSHRFIFEYYYGHICPDLQLDHLCRNRKCSNPLHLEQVTNKENSHRGMSPWGINSRKTYCIRGHKLTEDNIYRYGSSRVCKTCKQISNSKRDRRKIIA